MFLIKIFRRASFRAKLTLWYSLLLGILLTVAALFLINTLQAIAQRKFDATLWILGATEAEGITARVRDRRLQNPDALTVKDIDYRDLAGYGEVQVERYVTIVNSQHQVADFSVNLPNDQPLIFKDFLVDRALAGNVVYETSLLPQIGSIRLVYIPVDTEEADPFVVIVGVPTAFGGLEVETLSSQLIPSILLIIALTGLGGWLTARKALRPVVETTRSLLRITDQNLHERLEQPAPRDEFSDLVKVLNDMLARLERAFEVQRRFTADASHEISTPLTIIKGNTEVALLKERTQQEYEQFLQSNLEEVERLVEVTGNLLSLARSDAGELQIQPNFLILNELAQDVYDQLLPAVAESGIEFELRHLAELILVSADYQALRQVVFNLASNALRYTPRGGKIEIIIALTIGNLAEISIRDNGIGIPAEALPNIFDRFFRAENARSFAAEGSGLGLAICQTIIIAHNGKLSVESLPDKGTSFTIQLPVEKITNI